LKALPRNLETGLQLLERGHYISSRGKIRTGRLPKIVLDLFRRLDREEIEWVLVGAEGINLYLKRPRATVDVDIVVRKKHLAKARKILKDVGTGLNDAEVRMKATLSGEPNSLEVDVIKSQSHPLFERALDSRVLLDGVPTPSVEALLALKFLSAVSPWRLEEDKHQDVSDFIRCFKDNKDQIDRAALVQLASLAHKNAAKEFPAFLEAVENDRPIAI